MLLPKPLRHEQIDTLAVKLVGSVPEQKFRLSVGEQYGSRFADATVASGAQSIFCKRSGSTVGTRLELKWAAIVSFSP